MDRSAGPQRWGYPMGGSGREPGSCRQPLGLAALARSLGHDGAGGDLGGSDADGGWVPVRSTEFLASVTELYDSHVDSHGGTTRSHPVDLVDADRLPHNAWNHSIRRHGRRARGL